MFHGVGRDGEEGARDSTVTGDFAATDRVDRHPAAVRRVFDGKPQLEVQGDFPKASALHPKKTDLIVVLPRDVV